MTALIVLFIITAVFACILLLPIRFRAFFSYSDDGVCSDMTLRYGFIKIRIPSEKKGKKTEQSSKKKSDKNKKEKSSYLSVLRGFLKKNLKDIKDLLTAILKRLLSKTITVDKLCINVVLGFDDAMSTGLIYGSLAGVIYNIAGLMDRKMRLKKHDIVLKPDFDNPHIFAEVQTILSTNIFNVILLAIVTLRRALPLYKKLKNMIGENDDVKSD